MAFSAMHASGSVYESLVLKRPVLRRCKEFPRLHLFEDLFSPSMNHDEYSGFTIELTCEAMALEISDYACLREWNI